MTNRWGNNENSDRLFFFFGRGSKITADGDCRHEIKRCLPLGRKAMTNLDSILKSRYVTLPTKSHLINAMFFQVVTYGCESCTIKKAEHQKIDALNHGVGEDAWESLGLQGSPTVHPKGNQSWIFIGRTDAEAETPILWSRAVKNWRIAKDPDAGRDWRREEKGKIEDERIGWHHWLNVHEFG